MRLFQDNLHNICLRKIYYKIFTKVFLTPSCRFGHNSARFPTIILITFSHRPLRVKNEILIDFKFYRNFNF